MKAFRWTIEGGTRIQRQSAADAIRLITFPFSHLRRIPQPIIRFRDLSEWNSKQAVRDVANHSHHEPHTFQLPRRFGAAGLFWQDGRIVIHDALSDQEIGLTAAAEIAHSVDEYLPIRTEMEQKIMRRIMPDLKVWWGGDDYWKQGGEAWMDVFIDSYSSLGRLNWPTRMLYNPELVHSILGIQPVRR